MVEGNAGCAVGLKVVRDVIDAGGSTHMGTELLRFAGGSHTIGQGEGSSTVGMGGLGALIADGPAACDDIAVGWGEKVLRNWGEDARTDTSNGF
jgi:hypothetical protein